MNENQFTRSIRAPMDVFIQRSMRSWWRFARSTGLSMPQFSILMQLFYRGACGMSQVSDRFEITPAAASQLVDKLVQGGFIVRAEDPTDRRARMLNLTDRGRELVEQGIAERYRWVEELAGKLTPDEREKVSEALTLMSEAAGEWEAQPAREPA